jgi:hypothetical protein
MEDFEQKLKDALARKDQPPTFEAKVFAACARERSASGSAGSSAPGVLWRWEIAAVAATILLAAVSWTGHERQERAAGEAAKARLQLALKITVTELGKIQRTVQASTEEE